MALPVEKEPWTLPKSVFAPRARRGPQQSDAKDYLDTPKVIESMFENDWSRMMAKVRRLGLPLLCDVVRTQVELGELACPSGSAAPMRGSAGTRESKKRLSCCAIHV